MDVRKKVENEKRREEMTEYIKKDELLKFKADVYDEDGHVLYAVPTGCIVAMPPEDVMQVRHGWWVQQPLNGTHIWRCSKCETIGSPQWNYCPKCGAKMDEENIHE